MRVFMMTDLEGPCGVNGRPDGIGNRILNPEIAAKALTNEVNACIEGLVAAGADCVTVVDGHGGSNTLNVFDLHPAAELVQYGGTFYGVWPDATLEYDAAVSIGAHAMQNSGGYMCHSFSSHSVSEIRLNGKPIGEIGIGALIYAYFGIPFILLSGDEAACKEGRDFVGPELTTVATKQAYGRYSVRNYPREKVYAELREKSRQALENRASMPIMKMPESFVLEYEMMCPNHADQMEANGGERVDFRTVRFKGTDFLRVWFGKTWNAAFKKRYGHLLKKA